ncbi:pilus assembly protein PilX [Stutzerimonas stutzeri]|uniref:Pilus assembly protein PilX n=1 Tax=Stutzerimonas stutzeri TaxID=316 RepID=W8R7H1_STUST|nr:PilX N-terminal domain-containing pilus assembly protein [Stutzerimonas stutzeri]AHL74287.1 pilus assembly protein PilX [Stutzerimonas stutzeri]MCQ4330776.1 PilX N-terminal domain-containing pilus assembly protein [Stutzerimonas stutzeri]
MTPPFRKTQKGAVLLVSLVMLLVLTLLAVSSMRGVTLESRITASRAHDMQLKSVADAALREAEFRFYGPGNLVEKLEAQADNCAVSNTLKTTGLNKPCLLAIKTDHLLAFVDQPESIDGDFLEASSNIWMPYRGTDPTAETEANTQYDAAWHSILAVETGNAAVNAEYGMVAEGQGTYFYLNNGKAADALYLQSTHANIYLGLNN